MEISVKEQEQYLTFNLKGRLDLTSSTELKEKVKEFLNQGKKNILLNLSKVDFINSSGLGTLVSTLKEVRMVKGRIALCCLAPYVQEIFEITQLSHIFDIYTTEDEAQQAVSQFKMAGTT
ncbi:MAG: anti-sigma factor antagonist [candidate division Zixibacteria bacterium]|jgi:anti-sigma B factor antagonist|nr:anti-sigma factor antagonist [candidate division Zixibacteria bacterium]